MKRADLLKLLDERGTSPRALKERKDPAWDLLTRHKRDTVKRQLIEAFEDAPAEVREHLRAVNFDKVPVERFLDHASASLQKSKLSREAVAVALERLDRIAPAVAAAARPLEEIERVDADSTAIALIERARLHQLGEASGLREDVIEKVADEAPTPQALHDATLAALVEKKTLKEDQARVLGLTVTLYELLDENATLAGTIRNAKFARLDGKPPASTRDLAVLDRQDWRSFLDSSRTPLPQGVSADEYAARMAARFSALHPEVAFPGRLPRVDTREVAGLSKELQKLQAKNPRVMGVDFSALDTSDLSASEVQALRQAHTTIQRLVRAYPGLKLEGVLDDRQQTPVQKAAIVERRVNLLREVVTRFGDDRNILDLDLSAGSAEIGLLRLDELNATEEERRLLPAALKGYQRMVALTGGDIDEAQRLLNAGFTGSIDVGGRTLDHVMRVLGPGGARYWRDARARMIDVSETFMGLVDAEFGRYDRFNVGNIQQSASQYLRRLDGYETLFGSLAFCTCEHCQSVLGQPAYFVDLMRFVDEHIRPQLANLPNHALDLHTRRPDLWTLELTCANTAERIPMLDIINAILENYIARRRNYNGPLTDRVAVHNVVYRDTLADTVQSLRQPFHRPLDRIHRYLWKLESSRTGVARTVGASADIIAASELRLSPREWALVTTPENALGTLNGLFGFTFVAAGNAVGAVDAQDIVQVTGLTRDQLGEIARTAFVNAGGVNVTITAERRDANSVQNDIERIHGLTIPALDRLHRFTRLWRKQPWTVTELDRVLTAIGENTLAAAGLRRVGLIRELQVRLGLGADEAAAMAGRIPVTPAGASLMDRLFNPREVPPAETFPRAALRLVHPAFRSQPPLPGDPILPRLLAGLGLDLDALATLVRSLAPYLTKDGNVPLTLNDADENERYFTLTAANLALLYRHARLARALRLTIPELVQLMAVAGFNGRAASEADVLTLLDEYAWWKASGYSLDDVAVATGGAPRNAAGYHDPAVMAAEIAGQGAAALRFRETIFAVALGTTEQASRDLLAANATLVEDLTGGWWRLVPGVDRAAVAVNIPASAVVPDDPPPATRAVTAAEVRAVLAPYDPAAYLATALATALDVEPARVEALARFGGRSLRTANLAEILYGNAPIDELRTLVAALVPLAVAFKASQWTPAAIDFVAANRPAFDAAAAPLTVSALHALTVYADLARLHAGNAAALAALDQSIIAYDAVARAFPVGADNVLGLVFGVDAGVSKGLRGRVVLPAVAAQALGALGRAVALAVRLALDGEALAAIVSTQYAALDRAAAALRSAIGARYESEAERKTQLDLLDEPLREHARDGLVAYLIHSLQPRIFREPDDLYSYFLIDVQAGGCMTSSLVVAAISSVQLYIHRVIMRLEQTEDQSVVLALPETAAAEWTWRKNYRVWEANRKVFLWPENYIEPDLRDDKTALFRELESELLQTDLTEQDVLDAYTKYLRGFEELASLTIAGAYHDVRTESGTTSDVLHLFGVASTDPPVCYYRTGENLIGSGVDTRQAAVWTPWRKVEVQITGRYLSPIVYANRLHVFWTNFRTRPINRVSNGASTFSGYHHTMSAFFSTLRPGGAWTAPQPLELPLDGYFGPSRGVINDPLGAGNVPRFELIRRHDEPADDYTLRGDNWEWLWFEPSVDDGVDVLGFRARNFQREGVVDLFHRRLRGTTLNRSLPLPSQVLCQRGDNLYYGLPRDWGLLRQHSGTALANIAIEDERVAVFRRENSITINTITNGLYTRRICDLPERDVNLLAIPGSPEDAILQHGPDVLLFQGSVTTGNGYLVRRIGTTLSEELSVELFVGGLDGLLDTQFQLDLQEHAPPLTNVDATYITDSTNTGTLDFKGAYGVYYRELFHHIPSLIANALNARGQYASAQRWYHYIFDPTATEVIQVPAGTPAEERARLLLDRVWRHVEFRNLDVTRLREILTDEAALAVYRKDPFNPHAIARLRITAYAKSIVMKYVDNLLDWADHLFTQFTMESVNEATMLYVMASDILGRRPAQLGDCGEGLIQPKTYQNIAPTIGAGEEVLNEVETLVIGRRFAMRRFHRMGAPNQFRPDGRRVARARNRVALDAGGGDPPRQPKFFDADRVGTVGWNDELAEGATIKRGARRLARRGGHRGEFESFEIDGGFGWGLIRQVGPVFCIPVNKDLLAYWDRVEDRLFKIRHCQDITGQARQLALSAPEIDPRLLVRLRASGLSLEDVLGATSGSLPPYRFLFLVDRAKSYAATLGSFGGALLSAIERKDGEEMSRLRTVHLQNLARLTTQSRRLEIRTAEESLEALRKQLLAAEYRRDFYAGLVAGDRNQHESEQTTARHLASTMYGLEATVQLIRGITALVPQVGSPFAMKFGGVELQGSAAGFAAISKAVAQLSEAVAASSGLEATFDRRKEGWEHQQELAKHDVAQLTRQITAATLRVDIANRALAQHERSIEQLDEVLELMDGKFSNLGLYTWLAAQLRRLYRDAYQNALALGRLAEQAFRFERGDETSPGLLPTYWDATRAGLLAGEPLLIDLQNLERRYLETNYRTLEIDQAFALSQIAPDALLQLRQDGQCQFTIGELFFNLFYPGHYRRRIKAVRLTIPSITGPYVNVSATLTLQTSWIRPTPTANAPLVEVPPRRSVSVATSTAQNDAGVFELSFRDERYMPFEGAGAISEWLLQLPRTFRQFDYGTINDVIVSISYTAEHSGSLRAAVETDNANLEGTIRRYIAENQVGRLFSLRQDFSSAFTHLVHSPAGTDVGIEITDRHFPLFVGNRAIVVTRSAALLRTRRGVVPGAFELSIDGTAVNGFVAEAAYGNLPARPLPNAFTGNARAQHVLRVTNAGGLAPDAPVAGDASVLDSDKVLDILLYLEYTVPAP